MPAHRFYPDAGRPAPRTPACRLFGMHQPGLCLQRTGNQVSATLFRRGGLADYSVKSESSFGGGQKPGNARIPLAGKVHSLRKRLEQRLDHVVRLAAIKQLQMQVAARFVGESLKKLLRQPEPERTRHVLTPFRSA